MRVLAGKCNAWGGAARVPTPQGPETDSPETRGPETDLVRRPGPETTVPGGDPRKCRETAVYPGKAWHRAMQGGWVGFEMKPQVWVKARSKTANA